MHNRTTTFIPRMTPEERERRRIEDEKIDRTFQEAADRYAKLPVEQRMKLLRLGFREVMRYASELTLQERAELLKEALPLYKDLTKQLSAESKAKDPAE